MIKGSKPAQQVETNMGGIEATPCGNDPFTGRDDVMLDVNGLYSNSPEDGHQEFPAKRVHERVYTDDATTQPLPPTFLETNDEQNFEVSDTLGIHKEISKATANLVDPILPTPDEVTTDPTNVDLAISIILPHQLDEPPAVTLVADESASTNSLPTQPADANANATGSDVYATHADAPKVVDPVLPPNNADPANKSA